ncbi:helix-turn-helix transcriptional regulator [Nocardioides sp. TF02-7]|uniref:helix-turn-helix domain-containing protein n=1 Tax=Nocardioides sp. TF02-7 TaxID=2917724 RepID=UPI001F05E4DF|nr:helix-turn-helix transcriptional regulator [Nocardioides sp. TF02-7]UMG92883.1 helix-turn-helix transcriptional regulator [Nocardioides sp. TF02-7]
MSRVREVDYRWHLRQLMATRGLFSTTDLAPLLAERGIELSAAQVYRLVTGTPERLNLHVLVALCDALGCTPGRPGGAGRRRGREASQPPRRRRQGRRPRVCR